MVHITVDDARLKRACRNMVDCGAYTLAAAIIELDKYCPGAAPAFLQLASSYGVISTDEAYVKLTAGTPPPAAPANQA